MTKTELYDLINNTEKENEDGYSRDDIYKFYIENIKMTSFDRLTWKEFVQAIGWTKSITYLRRWLSKRRVEDGIQLPKNTSKSKLEDLTNDIPEDERARLIKERYRVSDVLSTYKSYLKQDSRWDSFKDELLKELKNFKVERYKPCQVKVTGNKEAIMLISDWHLGVDCNNFYNTYNLDIARERMNSYINRTINYCKMLGVKTLHVLNLGDMIHGYIHNTLRIESQMQVVEQVRCASQMLVTTLMSLSEKIPNVTYRSCIDNHSRMTANKKDNIDDENFQFLIDDIVELSLKVNKAKVNFIKDNLSNSIIRFKLNDGSIVMASHGDKENPDKVIDNFTGAIGIIPKYVLMSHLHNFREKSYNGSSLIINGSGCGVEEYAEGKRLFSKPEQTLLVFDNNDLLTFRINLGD